MEQSYCERVFGKTIHLLEYDDVVQYFSSARKESEVLEFKSFGDQGTKDPKEHERKMYETICAMLNSSGGLIIWGAPIGTRVNGEEEKSFSGELTHVVNDIEPDTLTDRINNRIRPTPSLVRHQRLIGPKRIYVFEVDRSLYAPHEFDGTYFVRLFGQTRKAPHYLVEALMRRISFPDLRVGLRIMNVAPQGAGKLVQFRIGVVNRSRLQNERDLLVSVTVHGGQFENNLYDTKGMRSLHLGGQRMVKKASLLTLHHGHLHMEQDSFLISGPSVDRMVKIEVAVGGRFSPWKVSAYLLDPVYGVEGYEKYLVKQLDNVLVAELEDNNLLDAEWRKFF